MPESNNYNRIALAACFGTFIEWYDFLTFATLAVHFAALFFPADDPVAGLLYSLATFGIGMVVRPLGAAVFGSFGDRFGRRHVFIATIGIMGVATFLVGLLPTFDHWGWWATGLLILLRVIQGLAMGGEIGGANVYLAEHAPAEKRGAATSVLQWMGGLGILASTAQLIILQTWLSAEAFLSWGWRIPFLFSAVLLLLSFRARLALLESPVFNQIKNSGHTSATPLKDCIQDPKTLRHMLLLFFGVSAGGSVLFFSSQVYLAVYLKTVVQMNPVTVSWLSAASTCCLFPLTFLAGALSDRWGRRPVVLSGLLLGAVAIVPIYSALPQLTNQLPVVFALQLILVTAVALVTGPQTALLSELFSARTRYTAVGLPHNLSAGWIGGLSPYMVNLIASKSGIALIGLLYPNALLLLALLVCYFKLPETQGRDLSA
ncbi:MAG: MFS transporter [Betaproteobacteria bacterium]